MAVARRYGNPLAAWIILGVVAAGWAWLAWSVAGPVSECLNAKTGAPTLNMCMGQWFAGTGMAGGWMAWTWQVAAFFLFILSALITMTALEIRRPGGAPRRGVLGLDTTRGDRLFISLLGSAFIFLFWLWIVGSLLWLALIVALAWSTFVFWKV